MFSKLIFAAGELSTSNSRFSEELFRTKRKKKIMILLLLSVHINAHINTLSRSASV